LLIRAGKPSFTTGTLCVIWADMSKIFKNMLENLLTIIEEDDIIYLEAWYEL
jgi:hypothetical protein